MHSCACMSYSASTCVCMLRTENTSDVFTSYSMTLILTQDFSLTWNLWIQLHRPTSEPWGLSCASLPSAEITSECHPAFMCVLGVELGSLFLQGTFNYSL